MCSLADAKRRGSVVIDGAGVSSPTAALSSKARACSASGGRGSATYRRSCHAAGDADVRRRRRRATDRVGDTAGTRTSFDRRGGIRPTCRRARRRVPGIAHPGSDGPLPPVPVRRVWPNGVCPSSSRTGRCRHQSPRVLFDHSQIIDRTFRAAMARSTWTRWACSSLGPQGMKRHTSSRLA